MEYFEILVRPFLPLFPLPPHFAFSSLDTIECPSIAKLIPLIFQFLYSKGWVIFALVYYVVLFNENIDISRQHVELSARELLGLRFIYQIKDESRYLRECGSFIKIARAFPVPVIVWFILFIFGNGDFLTLHFFWQLR